MQTFINKILVAAIATVALGLVPGTAAAAKGCGDQCLRSAIVTPSANAAKIAVKTYLKTNINVQVREHGAADRSLKLNANSRGITADYTAYAPSLKPATTYDIKVRAVDIHGNVTERSGKFHTLQAAALVEPATDALAGNTGCAAKCITSASVTPNINTAKFDIKVNTPVTLKIQASRKAPLPTSAGPMFAKPEINVQVGAAKYWDGKINTFEQSSKYYVILRATDEHGRTYVAQSSFKTLTRHVHVRFQDIRVTNDADKGANAGELTFRAAVAGQPAAYRGESKIDSDTTVHFPNGGKFDLDGAPQKLDVAIQGVERDDKFGLCFDGTGLGGGSLIESISGSFSDSCANYTFDTAVHTFDLGREAGGPPALPPGYGGAQSMIERRMHDDGRASLNFNVLVGVDVWAS